MTTTLVPPSYYVVKPNGQPPRHYRTVADAAAAIVLIAPTPTTVEVLTGSRRRSLTDTELRELGAARPRLAALPKPPGQTRSARAFRP